MASLSLSYIHVPYEYLKTERKQLSKPKKVLKIPALMKITALVNSGFPSHATSFSALTFDYFSPLSLSSLGKEMNYHILGCKTHTQQTHPLIDHGIHEAPVAPQPLELSALAFTNATSPYWNWIAHPPQ